jgi:putative transposase
MHRTPDPCRCHRFPGEIISRAVWLYHAFGLGFRGAGLPLAGRGVVVSHEGVRRWCPRFGRRFAPKLRGRRPRPGDTRHPDEVYVRINGVLHHLRRPVDRHGVVPDTLVRDRRNAGAARRSSRRLPAGLRYKPRRVVADGPPGHGAARREVLPEVRHRTSRYPDNRAGNSRRPTRRRGRQRQRFRSPAQARRLLLDHAFIHGHFRPRRHRMGAGQYRRARAKAFRIWRQATCVRIAA